MRSPFIDSLAVIVLCLFVIIIGQLYTHVNSKQTDTSVGKIEAVEVDKGIGQGKVRGKDKSFEAKVKRTE